MVFSSTVFLFIFLPFSLIGYYLIDRRFKNAFLLIVSLLFYAWGEPRFVFVMLGSILVNHVLALLIDNALVRAQKAEEPSAAEKSRKKAKRFLCLMVVFNLSLFFVYKYLNFTIRNVNAVSSLFGIRLLKQTNIILPIGISFFTFQAMSYVFDVYYRKGQVQKNPLNTALYISLFPQLIAGPIVRYQTVANEINNRQETLDDFAWGAKRFICGLAKKVILSNSLALLADHAFERTSFSELSVLMAWGGVTAYALQVYFDFGGYSDMAIGMGRMFGFHFDENFRYPYCSRTVAEFWQRWHISLGTWFRDYVFYPISMSKLMIRLNGYARKHFGRKTAKVILSAIPTAIVWFLTGLWHGADWHFIVWGCYYGFVLIMSLALDPVFKEWAKRLHINTKTKRFAVFQGLRTMLIVIIAYVFFRSNGVSNAIKYLGCMFGLMGNAAADGAAVFLVWQNMPLMIMAVVLSMPIVPELQKALDGLQGWKGIAVDTLETLLYVLLFVVSISFTVTSTYNPFIYFNF